MKRRQQQHQVGEDLVQRHARWVCNEPTCERRARKGNEQRHDHRGAHGVVAEIAPLLPARHVAEIGQRGAGAFQELGEARVAGADQSLDEERCD